MEVGALRIGAGTAGLALFLALGALLPATESQWPLFSWSGALALGEGPSWQLWRWFTYGWLSSGLWGLFFTLLALLFLGSPLEERYGAPKLWCLYWGGTALGGMLYSAFYLYPPWRPWLGSVVGGGAGCLTLLAVWVVLAPQSILQLWLGILLPIRALYLWWAALFGLLLGASSGYLALGVAATQLGALLGGSLVAKAWAQWPLAAQWRRAVLSLQLWRRRWRRRHLRCVEGGPEPKGEGAVAQSPGPKLRALGGDLKPARPPVDKRLELILTKLTVQGAKTLTEEERQYLERRSQGTFPGTQREEVHGS